MHKKLTITLDEQVYHGLHKIIGRGNISQFIESILRPHLIPADLPASYKDMADDEEHEAEAREWVEGNGEEIIDAAR